MIYHQSHLLTAYNYSKETLLYDTNQTFQVNVDDIDNQLVN